MSLSIGQALMQGAAGHWMQRVASNWAVGRSYPRYTSSQFLTRSLGSCLGTGWKGILSRALRSICISVLAASVIALSCLYPIYSLRRG